MKIEFMPPLGDYPEKLNIDIENKKNERVVEDILEILSIYLNENGFENFDIPGTRVILKNGTAVGRIESGNLNTFKKYERSTLHNDDRIAIIFPVNGG